MTAILGISAFYHDSAAALLVDGKVIAAAQEERFTRLRHDAGFPAHAIDYCLKEAGLEASQVDYVGFYDKPLLKFDRLLETYLSTAPWGFRSFLHAMPQWINQKLQLRRTIHNGLHRAYKKRVAFCEHHESHAASAFYPSPFESAAVIVADGVGEWATTSLGRGQGNELILDREIRFPHSLGLLYSAFTGYCGFRVNSGEYKLMGLAPYGEPRFAEDIRRHLIDIKSDGSFRLRLEYFDYLSGLTMTSNRFHRLFGGPPRAPESEISQREMDLAASIQQVTEEIMLKLATSLHESTGEKNLCLAGGVALNCVSNGRLLREGPFENIWVQPAAGDAGGALGVAQLLWHDALKQPRVVQSPDAQRCSLLGPQFTSEDVRRFLDQVEAKATRYSDSRIRTEKIAELLEAQKVIGLFSGRMEFGPRALGSRSILGDPRNEDMQRRMNLKIKFRESFRPFAPAVLAEHASQYFEIPSHLQSPYMLQTWNVRDSFRKKVPPEVRGLERRNFAYSELPAITHVDCSSRLQTVHAEQHPEFHDVISAFYERTGCPVVINTSFNVRGEPLVCTPEDAFNCFMASDMDVLVLEDHLLLKEEQNAPQVAREEHLSRFALD